MVEYLAGNRIRGTSAEKTSLTINVSPATEAIYDALSESDVSTSAIYGSGASDGRTGVRIDAGHSGIGKYINKVIFYGNKEGSPTGTYYCKIFNSSNVEVATSSGQDISLLNGGGTNGTRANNEHTLTTFHQIASGDVIAFTYAGGDSSNHLLGYSSSNSLITNTTPVWKNPFAYRPDRNIKQKFDSSPASAVVALNIEDGSIFYETDTNKSYVLNSGTWTEV